MTVYEVLTIAVIVVLGTAATAGIYLGCSTGPAALSSCVVPDVTT
jgi:hypothetical protein